jgi:hypothetical protein
MMDTYAVVASEVDAAPVPPAVFSATAIHTLAMDAMSDVGLAVSETTSDAHYYTGDIGWVNGYDAEQPIKSIPTT